LEVIGAGTAAYSSVSQAMGQIPLWDLMHGWVESEVPENTFRWYLL
jgi:hypothetical protein